MKHLAPLLIVVSLLAGCSDILDTTDTGLPLSAAVKSEIMKERKADALDKSKYHVLLGSTDLRPIATTEGDRQLAAMIDKEIMADIAVSDAQRGYMTEKRKEEANDASDQYERYRRLINDVLARNGIENTTAY